MGKLFRPDSRAYQIFSTAASFIALNLLWLLCSLPLVTAGPSSAALYAVTRKMAKREDPTVMKEFFKAFRENFKKAFLASLILLLPMLLLLGYLFLMTSGALTGLGWLRTYCWIAVVIIAVVCSYVWPLLAWYDNSLGGTLKNALLLPLSNPPIALAVTALNLLPLILLLKSTLLFIRISFLWLAAGFALTAFVNTQLLRLQFRRFTPEDGDNRDL